MTGFPSQEAILSGPNGGAIQYLGFLPGGDSSYGEGVNASGQVAGYSFSAAASSPHHAFLSGANGAPLTAANDLEILPGASFSEGYGVNVSGQVTGDSGATSATAHAFLSGPSGGTLEDLGTLPGGSFSEGLGVNASGQVTGFATTAGGNNHAFLSGPHGAALTVPDDLGTLPGDISSEGLAVNDSGQVVGYSENASGIKRAFLFSGGVMTDLNTLITPGSPMLTTATGISDTGFITGSTYNDNAAFLLTPAVPEASSMVSLGLLLALGLGGLIVARRKRMA